MTCKCCDDAPCRCTATGSNLEEIEIACCYKIEVQGVESLNEDFQQCYDCEDVNFIYHIPSNNIQNCSYETVICPCLGVIRLQIFRNEISYQLIITISGQDKSTVPATPHNYVYSKSFLLDTNFKNLNGEVIPLTSSPSTDVICKMPEEVIITSVDDDEECPAKPQCPPPICPCTNESGTTSVDSACCFIVELNGITNDNPCDLCDFCNNVNGIYYLERKAQPGCFYGTNGCAEGESQSCKVTIDLQVLVNDDDAEIIIALRALNGTVWNDEVIFKKSLPVENLTSLLNENIPLDTVTNFRNPRRACTWDTATINLTSGSMEQYCERTPCEPENPDQCSICVKKTVPSMVELTIPPGFINNCGGACRCQHPEFMNENVAGTYILESSVPGESCFWQFIIEDLGPCCFNGFPGSGLPTPYCSFHCGFEAVPPNNCRNCLNRTPACNTSLELKVFFLGDGFLWASIQDNLNFGKIQLPKICDFGSDCDHLYNINVLPFQESSFLCNGAIVKTSCFWDGSPVSIRFIP